MSLGCKQGVQEISDASNGSLSTDTNSVPLQFIRDVTYGNSEDELVFSPGGFEVDQNGRVFIADRHEINVFSEDGEILKTLGGKGRGPGEFESVSILEPKIGSKRLFVYDEILKRINVYDIESLVFVNTIIIDPRKWRNIPELRGFQFENYFVLDDSTLLAKYEELANVSKDKPLETIYYLMNLDGDLIHRKIFSHTSNALYSGVGVSGPVRLANDAPFPNASTRSTLIAVDGEWNIYSLWTEDVHVMVQNVKSGDSYNLVFPFNKSKLNPNDIISSYEGNERMHQRAKNEEYLATWPAVAHLLVDDEGRIWIATITDDEETFEWWVISKRGEVISKFNWPGKRLERHRVPKQVQAVRNGYLYSREENKETSQVEFVRYKIIAEGNRAQ